MSLEKLRKPIAGMALLTTTVFGVGCNLSESSESHTRTTDSSTSIDNKSIIEVEACVAKHSGENYKYNNILEEFGEEMAGQITVATCVAIESCPTDNSPEEILTDIIKTGGTYSDEARKILDDPSNGGLVGLDELRNCVQMRVYNKDGIDAEETTGQPPMWFINRYPSND